MRPPVRIRGLLKQGIGILLLFGTAVARAAEDIHDIRAAKALPGPGAWPWPVLAGALVIIAGAGVYLWRRRHPAGRRLTLSEQALADLERARALMRPATAREFGIAVSEVLRHFIERRFAVVATQQTTEEFLQALLTGTDETLARQRPRLADILQQCDLVKFAGTSLAVEEMESLLTSAHGFVQDSGERPAS